MKGHRRSVTIYLSDSSSLKTLNLTLNNGNVSLQKIWNDTVDYNVTVREGSATFDQVVTASVININVSAGDINVANSKATTLNANIVGGNLNIDVSNYAAEFVSYNVKTSNSTLNINDSQIENGQHRVVTPSDIQQCLVKVDADDATVKIKDIPTANVKSVFLALQAAAVAIAAEVPHTDVAAAIVITIRLFFIFKILVPKIHMKIITIGVTNQAIPKPYKPNFLMFANITVAPINTNPVLM
jgi:hypothetical protein